MKSMSRKARQKEVGKWVNRCFGDIALDLSERVRRLLEEATELAQAEKLTEAEALAVVRYVYARAAGIPEQEVGGISITLLSYCYAKGLDVDECEIKELNRILSKSETYWAQRQNVKAKYGVGYKTSKWL